MLDLRQRFFGFPHATGLADFAVHDGLQQFGSRPFGSFQGRLPAFCPKDAAGMWRGAKGFFAFSAAVVDSLTTILDPVSAGVVPEPLFRLELCCLG